MLNRIEAEDLDYILFKTNNIWEEARNKTFFLTGSTSFVGPWLIESFLWINKQLSLNAKLYALTRDVKKFNTIFNNITDPALVPVVGSVESFIYPNHNFDFLIHAATFTDSDDSKLYIDNNITAFKYVMDFAVAKGVSKTLFTSSGAIYGKHHKELHRIDEDEKPDFNLSNLSSGYGISKYVCEFLCNYYADKNNIEIKIARLFTFSGPYLGLNYNYAIGNFIRDVINNQNIKVSNPGKVYRSYLYGADLAISLWTILFKGKSTVPYNVGSDEAITIVELAQKVAEITGKTQQIEINYTNEPVNSSYVPLIARAQYDLDLNPEVKIDLAIEKMFKWNVNNKI